MFLPQGYCNLRNNVLAVFTSSEVLAKDYLCDYVIFHRATRQAFFLSRESLKCTYISRVK